jgi:hypothetical protein
MLATKKDAAGVSLLHLLGLEEQVAFKYLHAAIMESMMMALSDPNKRICILTDAYDRFPAELVTQIHHEHLDLPLEEQDLEPLAFLSDELKGAQLRWTVAKKQWLYFVTVANVDYLLLNFDEFSILSDHLNLTYI